MKKLAMISMPMAGLGQIEVKERFRALKGVIEADGKYEVVDTLFDFDDAEPVRMGVKSLPLHYLGQSLDRMALCVAVFFAPGWEQARGCRVEYEAAGSYGLEVFYVRG